MVNSCCTLRIGQSLYSLKSTNLYSLIPCTRLQDLLIYGSALLILWYNRECIINVQIERNKLWIIVKELEQFPKFLILWAAEPKKQHAWNTEQKPSHHREGEHSPQSNTSDPNMCSLTPSSNSTIRWHQRHQLSWVKRDNWVLSITDMWPPGVTQRL